MMTLRPVSGKICLATKPHDDLEAGIHYAGHAEAKAKAQDPTNTRDYVNQRLEKISV